MRQALRYAVNYDELIQLLGGNATLVQEIIPIGFLGHTGNNPFSQDIEKAKALLAEAGVPEGTEIEFLVPTGTGPGGIEWANDSCEDPVRRRTDRDQPQHQAAPGI